MKNLKIDSPLKRSCLLGIALLAVILFGLLPTPALLAGSHPRDVTIIRDEYGVPHVYGNSLKATWFGVGYASAQDRLWQADVLRRLGTGTSAEIFGPSAVAGDVQARAVFGPVERRAALIKSASKETRTILKWYAAGVNAWIEEATATGRLPV
ncbi:MAG: penicillin acylase family protein, partial [Planctomycetota bacterium]